MQMILTTIAVVVDKARAQQSAISQLSSEYPNVAQFRCGAHTVNLMLKAAIESACTTTS